MEHRPQRFKQLQLSQIKSFCACARHGSFSAAARALHITHSAVWQQIRALEARCGVSLFRRQGHDLLLTEDGQVFLELSSSIVGAVDGLLENFQVARAEVERRLVVIGSPGAIAEELNQSVVEYCRLNPRVRVTLLSQTVTGTVDQLVSGEADMAILPVDRIEEHSPLVTVEPLCLRTTVLAAPHDHPLARKRRLRLEDLVKYPLMLSEAQDPWRKRVEEVFRRAGLLERLRVLLEVNIGIAMRVYVQRGLGVGLLPLPTGAPEFPGVCLQSLEHLFPPQQVVILWRRGSTPRPQARAFADLAHRLLSPKS
jgi:DNA-binding transcriptional LysR family regulator